MAQDDVFGDFNYELLPHPLLPGGHRFEPDEQLVVTEWGDVLPPVEFSANMLKHLAEIVERPRLDDPSNLLQLAAKLIVRTTFDDQLGCYLLPLRCEYDYKARARYPQITAAALGYKNQLAHRASAEIFLGEKLSGRQTPIDHRCRCHACWNPYHIEVVTTSENNRRKIHAARRLLQPTLFQAVAE